MIIKLLAMKNIFPVVIRLYRVIYLLIKHFCVVFVRSPFKGTIITN